MLYDVIMYCAAMWSRDFLLVHHRGRTSATDATSLVITYIPALTPASLWVLRITYLLIVVLAVHMLQICQLAGCAAQFG